MTARVRWCLVSAALGLAAFAGPTSAQPIRVKVGVLNDMSE